MRLFSFFNLLVSEVEILISHPRFYWRLGVDSILATLDRAPHATDEKREYVSGRIPESDPHVLSFGARHAQAMDNMQAHVPARLAKNLKLHRELQSGPQNAWLKDGGGLCQPAGSIHFDGRKLGELLKYIARGLTWHHWRTYVSPDHKMRVMFSPDISSLYFQEQLRAVTEERKVTIDLGRGTVHYAGAQAGEPPLLIFWGISMYGGVLLSHNARLTGRTQ